MNQRMIALFAALVITGTACGSDSKSTVVDRTAIPTVGPAGRAVPNAKVGVEPGVVVVAQADGNSATTATPTAPGLSTVASTVESTREVPVHATVAAGTNPVTDPAVDALSTFAMDVDTGSYTYARGSLQSGVIPDPSTVRTEEFVNAIGQDYAQPTDGQPFAVTVDATSAPFLAGDARVVRVGIQGRSVDDADRKDADLTFVIDISGSMADPGKLDTVRPALTRLVESLRPTDRVGIVVYSDDTRVLLPSTPVSERATIDDAIRSLLPEGATNVENGLRLGYAQAQKAFDASRINRVVLLSDGVANVGATGPEQILGLIEDSARTGIDLVTVGFGLGDYNDSLMEQLADKGDGFYAYVDGEREAVRLFTEDLTGTLETIAREAKVQVEFNPATVASYRLIGFENRQVADDAFRDDSVDGGEVGAGHSVTALYEITLHEGAGTAVSADTAAEPWLAKAAIHWLDADTRAPGDLQTTLAAGEVTGSIGDAPLRLQQDVYVAAFAETLRGSGWNGMISLSGLSQNLHSLATRLGDADLSETADLVDTRVSLG